MSRRKKSGKQDKATTLIILITAIITLIDKLLDIIQRLTK